MANEVDPMNYIDPQFGRYGPILGRDLTLWLYGDPKSNPTWNEPHLWPTGPRVHIVKRVLNFATIATSTTAAATKLSLNGGRNCVVFSCFATIKQATAPNAASSIVLPNQQGSYVTVQQVRTDGFIEVATMPINNAFGTVPGWPETYPSPVPWEGNSDRTLTVANTFTDVAMAVNLTWTIAVLDTAR